MLLPAIEAVWVRAEAFILQQRVETQELLDEKGPGESPEAVRPEELEDWEKLVEALKAEKTPVRQWADRLDPTMWSDGSVVRVAGLLAAVLIVAGLVAAGVTALA